MVTALPLAVLSILATFMFVTFGTDAQALTVEGPSLLDAHAALAGGSIKELSKRTVDMPKITNCQALGVCDLKSVKLIERKIKVLLPNERPEFASYMTDMTFVVELNKPANIPNYGVVQYLKGCMFESELLPNGTEVRRFTYAHKNFGTYKLIHHADWIVDSDHSDPLTTAFEGYGRFDLYKWNRNKLNYESDGATWYYNAKPPHGTVFKADLIANSGLIEGSKNPNARNSSLELQTCIFKIADLPTASDPEGTGIDRSKALWCADWDHKFGYDFARGKVVAETAINPTCNEPVTP